MFAWWKCGTGRFSGKLWALSSFPGCRVTPKRRQLEREKMPARECSCVCVERGHSWKFHPAGFVFSLARTLNCFLCFVFARAGERRGGRLEPFVEKNVNALKMVFFPRKPLNSSLSWSRDRELSGRLSAGRVVPTIAVPLAEKKQPRIQVTVKSI